jgi:ABC-type lipoprotein release transport system permease subunit
VGQGAAALLYELTPWDPAVLAISAALLAIVALTAGFIPARRASLIDPMRALRYE